MKIAVVYDSGYGHTAKLAESVAAGVRKISGAEAYVYAVASGDPDWAELESSDAIIFGSPTYNGSITAKLKAFMEAATGPVWVTQKWRNKIAAGFTNSGSMNGDKLSSLLTMSIFAAQQGMIWVGLDIFAGKGPEALNRTGGWLGAMAQSDDDSPEVTPIKSDLDTASYLGERVAELASQMARGRA